MQRLHFFFQQKSFQNGAEKGIKLLQGTVNRYALQDISFLGKEAPAPLLPLDPAVRLVHPCDCWSPL